MPLSLRDKLSVFDPELPLERAGAIPAAWYTDADVYALERRAVFGDAWLVAGRAADVAGPGSFLTAEIAGEPILVVRDEAGVLRAFANVCRHRAAPVATEPCGQASRLRCRYHGWTYDLAGRLRGARSSTASPTSAARTTACPPWPSPSGDRGCGSMRVSGRRPCSISSPRCPNASPARSRRRCGSSPGGDYEVACNWKVYVDNYLDGGYHVHTIHPSLAGVLDYAHYRTEIHAWNSVQISPLKPANDPDSAARTRGGDAAHYVWVYPNFMVNLYQGVMDTNLVLPLGPDRCRVVFDFSFAETEGAAAEAFVRDSMALADRIQREDVQICEQVQRGLGSRSYTAGRFSVRRENGGHHFHQLLGRRLRAALPS